GVVGLGWPRDNSSRSAGPAPQPLHSERAPGTALPPGSAFGLSALPALFAQPRLCALPRCVVELLPVCKSPLDDARGPLEQEGQEPAPAGTVATHLRPAPPHPY